MTIPMVNAYERLLRICGQSVVLVVAISACFCFQSRLRAQTFDFRTSETPNQLWTATTESNGDNLNRTTETHMQDGNRKLDTQSVDFWVDGRFQFNEDIERETLQLDANTVRVTTRKFSQDGNGRKTLSQVTEEEKNILPGGDSNIVRLTSSSDLNGALQPVRREVVETRNIGNGVEEANSLVMLPSIYGGLAPAMKMHELRKPGPNDTIESQITTLRLDGSGNWQVSQIRQSTITQAPNNGRTEERVFGVDSEGRLGEVSRRVSREFESRVGENVSVVETYSVNVPGRALDGNLHLVQRATTVQHTSATGEQITEQKVDVSHSGEPGSGLRPYMLINDTVQPGPSGFRATRTVRLRDVNENFEVVEVDTTKSDKVLTIQFQ